jgi:hypothetical protein
VTALLTLSGVNPEQGGLSPESSLQVACPKDADLDRRKKVAWTSDPKVAWTSDPKVACVGPPSLLSQG